MRVALSLLLVMLASSAEAVTLRYAIVIGNNRGAQTKAGRLPDLLHAEREAGRLHRKLIELCNFDESEKRTVLLKGPSREEVERAVDTLVTQIRLDEVRYGQTEKLFAFFFTGHGQSGKLVLRDGTLDRALLGQIFSKVDADLNFGVFDACYSGSLSAGSLVEKGVRPTPGQSVFSELPQEVLDAKGSVWFVSSGAEQPSYEDRKLGGVFTHYLIEALSRAPVDGPGISLERIWRYAHGKTVAYTTERHRPQRPEKIVRKLRSKGALYFSFPNKRDATLVLGARVQGRFLLSYKEGLFTERIEKQRGAPKRLAVYPGNARLMLLQKGALLAQEQLELRAGARIEVTRTSIRGEEPLPKIEQRVERLWVKGFGVQRLSARRIQPRASLMGGLSVDYAAVKSGLLAPRQRVALVARYDETWRTATLALGYGRARERFSAWGYALHAPFARASFGAAHSQGDFRLAAQGAVEAGLLEIRYDDSAKKRAWFVAPGLTVSLAHPISERFALELSGRAALLFSEGAGVAAPRTVAWTAGVGATAWVRIF